jgi:mRNA interferase HigB
MRVIAIRTLKLFWKRHPDAERPLRRGMPKPKAQWQGSQDIKAEYDGEHSP